jgi:hypothetical protein
MLSLEKRYLSPGGGPNPTTRQPTSADAQLQGEFSLEKTAAHIRTLFRDTITCLNEFPHGVTYDDKIYLETGHCSLGDRGQEVRELAVVTTKGEIRMIKATERIMKTWEWDLETHAESWAATNQEVVEYALPLMATVKIRSANARLKSIIVDRGGKLPSDSELTRKLTRDAISIETAMQRLSRLEPAA